MNLYAIFDKVAEQYGPPFMARNDKVATRMFVDILKQSKSPADYHLYLIGSFNQDNAEIGYTGVIEVTLDMSKDEQMEAIV